MPVETKWKNRKMGKILHEKIISPLLLVVTCELHFRDCGLVADKVFGDDPVGADHKREEERIGKIVEHIFLESHPNLQKFSKKRN